jgi:hypothetical protein
VGGGGAARPAHVVPFQLQTAAALDAPEHAWGAMKRRSRLLAVSKASPSICPGAGDTAGWARSQLLPRHIHVSVPPHPALVTRTNWSVGSSSANAARPAEGGDGALGWGVHSEPFQVQVVWLGLTSVPETWPVSPPVRTTPPWAGS